MGCSHLAHVLLQALSLYGSSAHPVCQGGAPDSVVTSPSGLLVHSTELGFVTEAPSTRGHMDLPGDNPGLVGKGVAWASSRALVDVAAVASWSMTSSQTDVTGKRKRWASELYTKTSAG